MELNSTDVKGVIHLACGHDDDPVAWLTSGGPYVRKSCHPPLDAEFLCDVYDADDFVPFVIINTAVPHALVQFARDYPERASHTRVFMYGAEHFSELGVFNIRQELVKTLQRFQEVVIFDPREFLGGDVKYQLQRDNPHMEPVFTKIAELCAEDRETRIQYASLELHAHRLALKTLNYTLTPDESKTLRAYLEQKGFDVERDPTQEMLDVLRELDTPSAWVVWYAWQGKLRMRFGSGAVYGLSLLLEANDPRIFKQPVTLQWKHDEPLPTLTHTAKGKSSVYVVRPCAAAANNENIKQQVMRDCYLAMFDHSADAVLTPEARAIIDKQLSV